ncbi:MAG: hypothetical protein NVSMB52_01140 [Chloroflexota bacterium]
MHDLLDGRSDRVAEWLEQKRNRLSDSLLFEHAAEVQARLEALYDYRRHHAMLEAAVKCRCVMILDRSRDEARPRLMLVSHGKIVGMRAAGDASAEQLARWVALHEPIMAAASREQNDLDSASVLERWLRTYRERVRWVAIRDIGNGGDLLDCMNYILQTDCYTTAATRTD